MAGAEERRRRLVRAVHELMAAERSRLGESPDAEALVAYAEGRLTGAERERVEAAVAADPEAARTVVALRELAAGTPVEEGEGPPAGEIADGWRRMRAELVAAGVIPEGGGETVVTRAATASGELAGAIPRHPAASMRPSSAPRPTGRPWLRIAAALVAGAGLAILAGRLLPPREPALEVSLRNPAVATLLPLSAGAERGAGDEPLPVAPEAGGLVLILVVDDPEPHPSYRLTVVDSTGRERFATGGLVRQPRTGTVTLTLPRRGLDSGRHRLTLAGVDGEREVPVATYILDLAVE